ncbi:MAG TPA: DSD1 family PLP-dependent enzyme [Verrucomicrobiae bacterium]|nr:DSD1 family PLP-dependent enzyme [Verrucomicrobiae bacterium]
MRISNPLATVDTPALLLDLDALRDNINKMASFFANRRCRLRPHFKSHKCTHIARMQMDAGAVGMTCAKLGEADVLAEAGIRDILIANEIVGSLKIGRLVALCARADPMVAVDSAENIRMLSAHAAAAGVTLRVLVEVDIGMGRCGVAPGQPAADLAALVVSLPGLKFEGLQGYEGHCVDLRDAGERVRQARAAIELLVNTRRLIERAGMKVHIVSGGGTGTYDLNGDTEGIDEVQAGSYAAMDWWYTDIRPEFRQAMSILTTVTSRAKPRIAIIDVGRKGVGAEWGPPRLKNPDDGRVLSYTSEEHMTIELSGKREFNVGDRMEIIPSHGCTTSNLYREFVVHQNGGVVATWPIEGSGKLQ